MTASAKEVIAAAIKSRPAWNTPYSADADAILAALDAAGLVVVPREPETELVWVQNTVSMMRQSSIFTPEMRERCITNLRRAVAMIAAQEKQG